MPEIANGIALIVELIINMAQILVIASIIVSWVSADPNNQIVRMIYAVTEPLYAPFRKFTKNIPGPFDWAPMAVLLLLVFLKVSIVPLIRRLLGGL
jgi:YggT family protein